MTGRRKNILGVDFDLIDYEQAVETVAEWRQTAKRSYITITNPHSVLMCHRDEEMHNATTRAGLVLPDGTGIIWAANILSYRHNGRVTGPTLMLKLCDWGRKKGLRHFFYGGAEDVADKLAEGLSKKYSGLQVAGTYSPPFRKLTEQEDAEIVDLINAAKPDILWVGLGAPKQEKWMADHVGIISATTMIGVGAAFDFHSGNVKWAPAIARKLGIEWLWRLAENPKRMWRRNLDSPVFLAKVIAQKIRLILHCK